MATIGLYVYQLLLRKTDGYEQVPFSDTGIGSELTAFLPTFIANNSASNQDTENERSWRMLPETDVGRGKQGIVEYGTYGFSSNLVDADEGTLLFERGARDVEEIPLYYQFWTPNVGHFGFAVLQSFRGRSCVKSVLTQLTVEFNNAHEHISLTVRKIMPTDDQAYRSAPVRKLIFSKKKVPKDRAEILRNLPPEELNVELSISPKRGGRFGLYTDLAPQIKAAAGSAAFVMEGIEFDEASALVAIGKNYRKVGIVGPSNTAGVIDITDDIDLNDKLHPEFESIAEVATQTISDFRTAYGMN